MLRRDPQGTHVALRDDDDWRSPSDPEYVGVFKRYAPSGFAAWLLISGGFIVETIAVFLAGYLLRDRGNLSLIILSTSSALFLIYVFGDWAASVGNKKPYGDVGALWAIQPFFTVLTLLALTAWGGSDHRSCQ